jgi:predicted lipoprotein
MVKTAGNRLSWLTLGGLGVAALSLKVGCAPIPQDDSKEVSAWEDEEVIRVVSSVLRGVGPEVVLPSLEQFGIELASLAEAIDAWETAFDSGADTAQVHADAKEAWTTAMMAWQEHEVMQIGPAGSSLTAVAGRDLRDEVYSWPSINPCRIDQEVVATGWTQSGWFEDNFANSYGLDALEHILHGDDENVCPSQVEINATGSWNALGPEGVEANRIAYARAVVLHLEDVNDFLYEKWSPQEGDFSGALALTSRSSPYATDRQALNAVFDALFYLETVTKDRKLAQPLGLVECSLEVCPDAAEHLESGISVMAVAANLRGFRQLFTGGDGTGFDDLLVELGHADLAESIVEKTDNALSVAEATALPIHEGVTSDLASVEALHAAVKEVTDILKGDLVTVLSLQIPAEASGDND